MHQQTVSFTMLFVILLLSVTGCGGDAGDSPSSSDQTQSAAAATQAALNDPAVSAQQWLIGALAADGLLLGRYTCRADEALVSDAALTANVLEGLLIGAVQSFFGVSVNTDVDMMDATFTVPEETDTTALVETGGYIRIIVSGSFETRELRGTMHLVYEDNRWKVCERSHQMALATQTQAAVDRASTQAAEVAAAQTATQAPRDTATAIALAPTYTARAYIAATRDARATQAFFQLRYGQSREARLSNDESHTWTFTGDAGDQIEIVIDGISAIAPHVEIRLYYGSRLLASSHQRRGLADVWATAILPEQGQYTIEIVLWNTTSASYEITVNMLN